MQCFNPYCSKPNSIYKTQRGFEQHLRINHQCMIYMQKLISNSKDYTSKSYTLIHDTNNNTFQHYKKFCQEDYFLSKQQQNIDYFNTTMQQHNLMNNNSTEFETMLHNDFYNLTDDNLYSSEESITSVEFEELDEVVDNNTETNLGSIYTAEQKHIIKLIKLLDDMNCPDYAFESIITWAREAFLDNYAFNPSAKTRKGNLNWIRKMVVHNNAFYPKAIPVALTNLIRIDVICFDFVLQLLHLLQNKKLMTQENLLIDVNNPTAMYKSPNNILSEALSGDAYKEVFQNAHAAHTGMLPLLVIPICIWGDATHIDTYGRFKLEPWSFSPLIFKEKARRHMKFWGMLGYVKHLKTTSAQRKKLKKGETMRMYHRQLSAILSSLETCKEKLQNIPIPFKDNTIQHFDIVCPLLYVIADTEGADKICGRYGSHNLAIQRHCRMCDVNSDNLDNENHECNYLYFDDMNHIAINGTEEERKQYSQHQVLNAFQKIDFGGQKYGLLSCTPPDILHVIRKGIVEWSVKAVLENLTDTTKANIDALAINFHTNHHQSYRNKFPKTNFPSGFTNLSNIRADEWLGILYLLVIISQTAEGWNIINNALLKGNNKEIQDVLYVFEMILCFDAWINQTSFWPSNLNKMYINSSKESIKTMMKDIKKLLPNPAREQGWKNPKFHLLLHFVDMIVLFGAPKNFDSQCPEHNHLYVAKKPGRKSQKTNNASQFESQVAQRVCDTRIIDEIHDTIFATTMSNDTNNTPNNTIDESTKGASKAKAIKTGLNSYSIEWKNKKYNNVDFLYKELPEFLCLHYKKDEVIFSSEYVRGGYRYRCHPNFYNQGNYYDWMYVLFDDNNRYPCKLIACVSGEDNNFEGYHLIVQCADKKAKENSVLFCDYYFDQQLVQIDANCCDGPCFVVDMDPEKIIISAAVDKEEWPNEFTDNFADN